VGNDRSLEKHRRGAKNAVALVRSRQASPTEISAVVRVDDPTCCSGLAKSPPNSNATLEVRLRLVLTAMPVALSVPDRYMNRSSCAWYGTGDGSSSRHSLFVERRSQILCGLREVLNDVAQRPAVDLHLGDAFVDFGRRSLPLGRRRWRWNATHPQCFALHVASAA
jgi:hypothetical protein